MTIMPLSLNHREPVDAAPTAPAASDPSTADVALAAAGDRRAFERLYRAHAARVHALVRRMLSAAEADLVVQDVFVRAWSRLATFRGDAAFSTWLHRLAVNVCLSERESSARERRRFHEAPDAVALVPAPPAAPELAIDVESAIAQLPLGMRRVLVLHDLEGFTHEEIAERLQIAPGTSKSQLHRARLMLRPLLER